MSTIGHPPKRFESPIPDEVFGLLCDRLRSGVSAVSEDEVAATEQWVEKSRRFAELNRGSLAKKCQIRGMSEADAAKTCRQVAEVLALAGGFPEDGQSRPDLPSLNAALILLDSKDIDGQTRQALQPLVEASLARLPGELKSRTVPWASAAAPVADQLEGIHVERNQKPWAEVRPAGTGDDGAAATGRVVIMSPNPYSLFTLAMMGMLIAHGVEISAVVVRSMWSVGRVKEELNYGRNRLVSKVVRKLILKTDESSNQSGYTMKALCQEVGVSHRSAIAWAKELNIPTATVKDLNDPALHRLLDEQKPDYGVFTGGGLVRTETLQRCGVGLLNAHPGILPQYRGVDVAHWPLLEGHPDQVGATVYVMDEGVDTGAPMAQMFVDPAPFEDHGSLRNDLVALKSVFLADVVKRLVAGELQPKAQPNSGRLYFSMHPALEEMMDLASRQATGSR